LDLGVYFSSSSYSHYQQSVLENPPEIIHLVHSRRYQNFYIFRALWRWGARSALGRHVKDEHVKDAAQDMAQDVAQDVAVAAEDGSVKVLYLYIVIFQGRNPCPTHACRPPRCPWAAP